MVHIAQKSNLLFAAVAIVILISSFLLTNTLPIIPGSSSTDIDRLIEQIENPGSHNATIGPPPNTPTPSNTNNQNQNGDSSGMGLGAEGPHKLSETPVLEIQGKPYTSVIRGLVGEIYQSGGWAPDPSSPVSLYNGNYLDSDISLYSSKTQSSITITPLQTISRNIVTPVYTNKIEFMFPITSWYYSDLRTFAIGGSLDSTYNVESTHYEFSPEILSQTQIASTSDQYYQVPSNLKSSLDLILGQIDFSTATSIYDRITAIKAYLQTNYVYDLDYTNAPSNVDPVQWFLLSEKRGVCANFNSAFALLLRENGIPSRVVGGYAGIDATADEQIVKAKQGHLWVEVKYQNIGWVEFDATGFGSIPLPPRQLETKTEITNLSPSTVKGGQFLTVGKVTDLSGNPASGLTVKIYLKISKEVPEGLFCGSGTTANDGTFSITSNVSKLVSVGNYQVVAKTIGNEAYSGSDSDPALTINSQTKINATTTGQVEAGKSFNLVAQLLESTSDAPLANQHLKLTYNDGTAEKQIVAVTDQTGYATLNFASIPQVENNKLNYSISFDQNGFYLASIINRELDVFTPGTIPSPTQSTEETTNFSSFFESPVFYASIILALAIPISTIIVLKKRKKPVPVTSQINIPLPIKAETHKPSSETIISILFQQIKSPFPDVWGINELLTAQISLTKKETPLTGEVEIQIGNNPIKKMKTDTEGTASIDFKIPTKGTINVTAKYQQESDNVTATRSLKIVDYTEEIVAIFKDVFNLGKGSGIRMNKDTSPREFQQLILGASNQQTDSSLERFITTFEVADYSLYTLGRPEYEHMFLGSISIKQLLSRKTRFD